GLRGYHARDRSTLLVLQLLGSRPLGGLENHLARAARGTERPERLEAVSVLLHRIRRLRRDESMDGAVLRWRIRAGHPQRRFAGRMLFASWRSIACGRRLGIRQVRRTQRDLVG